MKDIKNIEAELTSICDSIINEELLNFSDNVQSISANFTTYREDIGKKMIYEAGMLIHDYIGFINSLEVLDKIRNILQYKSVEFNVRITHLLNLYNKEK